MLIFAIDDEPKMLRLLHQAIAEAAPEEKIMDFPLGSDALQAIEAQNLCPDVVFSDIQMPPPTGLEFAVRLKKLVPDAKVVFVTGYDHYAVQSYQVHASGYILKPVRAERIREELENIMPAAQKPSGKLQVRCFGYFEVFRQGEPLVFARNKTRELFAFLVDRRGAAVSSEEAATVLYEDADPESMKKARQNIRNLISDMKNTLNGAGMRDVLIRKGTSLALRTDLLDCDYLRMLQGDMEAVNSFRGEYMEQYSWAELTKGSLAFDRNAAKQASL